MTYWLLGPEAARKWGMCAKIFIRIPFSVIVQKEKVSFWLPSSMLLSRITNTPEFLKDHQKTRLCAYLVFCIKKHLEKVKYPFALILSLWRKNCFYSHKVDRYSSPSPALLKRYNPINFESGSTREVQLGPSEELVRKHGLIPSCSFLPEYQIWECWNYREINLEIIDSSPHFKDD